MDKVKGLSSTLLLVAILFVFIGPNFRILSIPGHYFFFYGIIYLILFINNGGSFFKTPIIISLPFYATLLSLLTKIAFGETIIFKDFWFVLRYLNLIIIFIVISKLLRYYSVNDIYLFINSRIYRIIFFIVFFIAVFGFLQYLGFNPSNNAILNYWYKISFADYKGYTITNFDLGEFQGRIVAIYFTPLVLGTILMYLLIFLLGINQKRNLWFYFFFSFSTFVLFLTDSRAALISSFIAYLIIYFLKSKGKAKYFKLSFVVITFIIIFNFIWVILPHQYALRFNELFNISQENPATLNARITDMQIIWEILIKHTYWLYGIPQQTWTVFKDLSAGNQWFTWFQLYGIFSIALIVWYLYLPFYFWKHIKSNNKVVHQLAIVLFAIFIAGNISNLTQVSALLPRVREFNTILIAFFFAIKNKVTLT